MNGDERIVIDVTQQQYRSFYFNYFFMIGNILFIALGAFVFVAYNFLPLLILVIFMDMITSFLFTMVLILGDRESVMIQYRMGLSKEAFRIRDISYCQVTSLPWFKLAEVKDISGFNAPDMSVSGNAVEVHLTTGKVIRFKDKNPQDFIDFINKMKSAS